MKPTFKILAILWIVLYTFTLLQANTQQDMCQFKKVIKNGWSEDNKTLNHNIIFLAKGEIPRIIKNLEYPLKPDTNKSSIPPFPKIIINRDDYTKLFAYSKYLESQNKLDDVIQLYVNAYQGLNTIKMSSFLPFVYLIALNIDINKSLTSSLKHHIFTKKEKMLLYQNLAFVLILDDTKLIDTLKAERNITQYYVNTVKIDGDYVIDKRHLKIFKEHWEIYANKYYSSLFSAIKKGIVEKFIKEKKKKRKSISIATHIKFKLLQLKLKLYNTLSIKIDREDYMTLSAYRIHTDLYMNTKAIDNTIRDYDKMIENNKKLLQKLKEIL